MSQLDCLLAALLQLAHAPLKKPTDNQSTANISTSDFEMTPQLYLQLKNEQESFYKKLQMLIEDCPQSVLVKELMVILSIKNNPKWLLLKIKHHLTERIMLPNGITALTLAICNEVSDLGKCWDKLDVTAKLVATSHGSDTERYYRSVCSQVDSIFFFNSFITISDKKIYETMIFFSDFGTFQFKRKQARQYYSKRLHESSV